MSDLSNTEGINQCSELNIVFHRSSSKHEEFPRVGGVLTRPSPAGFEVPCHSLGQRNFLKGFTDKM